MLESRMTNRSSYLSEKKRRKPFWLSSVCRLSSLAFGFLPAWVALSADAYATTITGVDYSTNPLGGEVWIRADGEVAYESEELSADRQIVIKLKGAELSPDARKKIDTSTQEGPVLEITPYQVEGGAGDSRVVIQLRQRVSSQISREGNAIRVSIPVDLMAEDSSATEKEQKSEGEKNLDVFMKTMENKKFSGKPVTIQVRDADLSDVLRLIAEASGFNILVGDGVGGKITLSLAEVPWDQALDVILSSKRLGAERRNNILRIATLTNLTAEKEEALRAKQAAEKAAPRITRVFPISYAEAGQLQGLLQNFSNYLAGLGGGGVPGAAIGGGAGGTAAVTGAATIQIDQRTNSLIIQDTASGLESLAKLIKLLDTETPQVMIEAKVVEATEDFSKELGGSLGFSRLNADSRGIFGSFVGAATTTGLTGAPSSGNTPSSQLGYAPSAAFLPNWNRLNMLLRVGETNSKSKVVASPKTVVMNKKTATIVQSTPVAIPVTTLSAGVPVNSIQVVQANLSLNVTPTVTNTGSVLLNLNISRDSVQTSGNQALVAPRNMTTEVLVDSGSTLVIGGVYTIDRTWSDFGFPFLKDIPLLGVLFGAKSSTVKKSELLIFISPRIINEKAAGVGSGTGIATSSTGMPTG
ncbi:MAG: fimbrial assembly protein [Pseudomonadota bacterium]